MRGVDVQRVVASSVTEDNQDIEDAPIQTSMEEMETIKKLGDLKVSSEKLASTTSIEIKDDNKSVGFVYITFAN